MEVAGQNVGQRQMTHIPGSLDTSHEALAFCLSLPGNPCPGCHWPGVGRFGGEHQASPRHPTSPLGGAWLGQLLGATTGVCPWSPTAVCALIPAPWSPPGWQVG